MGYTIKIFWEIPMKVLPKIGKYEKSPIYFQGKGIIRPR